MGWSQAPSPGACHFWMNSTDSRCWTWHEVICLYQEKNSNDGDVQGLREFMKTSVFGDILFFGNLILQFHEGVHENDFQKVHAARTAFLPMWWTCSHPVYRMVIPAFLRDYIEMPEILKSAVRKWMHGSISGTPEKFEGLDFVE